MHSPGYGPEQKEWGVETIFSRNIFISNISFVGIKLSCGCLVKVLTETAFTRISGNPKCNFTFLAEVMQF